MAFTPSRTRKPQHRLAALLIAPLVAALAACTATPSATQTPLRETNTLTVVTHDSFAVSQALLDQFKAQTGYTVTMVAPGDAGTMVNQLVLTKNSPLGDVVFGIDNTLAGRAIDQGILAAYAPSSLSASAAALKTEPNNLLTPIDFGDVCINADTSWFTSRGLDIPVTLDDLTKPAYRNLLVVENPASSSPGLAFLLATISAKGEAGYRDYWSALKTNGVKVVSGWTEAYSVEFSGSSGKGNRPLVVSYSTSPAFEVPEGGTTSRTTSLLSTCFRQVEYAAVLKGAQNEVGARKFIDFLISKAVQADIPGQMYMYPADQSVDIPADWRKFAPLSDRPFSVPVDQVAANRDAWVRAWTATVIG